MFLGGMPRAERLAAQGEGRRWPATETLPSASCYSPALQIDQSGGDLNG